MFNDALYFRATDGTQGEELVELRADGTFTVFDINPGGDSGADNFTVFNNALYFTADDGTTGTELYRLDTQGNLTMTDIAAVGSSFPDGLIIFTATA